MPGNNWALQPTICLILSNNAFWGNHCISALSYPKRIHHAWLLFWRQLGKGREKGNSILACEIAVSPGRIAAPQEPIPILQAEVPQRDDDIETWHRIMTQRVRAGMGLPRPFPMRSKELVTLGKGICCVSLGRWRKQQTSVFTRHICEVFWTPVWFYHIWVSDVIRLQGTARLKENC